MNIATNFKIGMELFTREGNRVELLAITTDDKYVVSQIVRMDTYDGSYDYGRGETWFETELFQTAPVKLMDEKLVAKRAEIAELEKTRSERMRDVIGAEKDIKDRLAKLSKYKGLERIEDFIEGRITHFVVPYSGSYVICTLKEFEAKDYGGRAEGIRLMSLYGNSKGDLSFLVNQYRDGSGGEWKEIIPCASEEEAGEKLKAKIAEDLAVHFTCFNAEHPYWFFVTVESAQKHGVPVSEEVMSLYLVHKRASLSQEKAKLQKDINEKLAKIAELDERVPS